MPTNPSAGWQGLYLDGETALARPVTLSLHSEGLQSRTEDGQTRWWPYAELTQTQGQRVGEHVRLELGQGDVVPTLVISAPGFLDALREQAPDARFRAPASATRRWSGVAGMLAATAGLVAGFYVWGIPVLADVAAAHVPIAWEEALGKAVSEQLAPPERRCTDPRAQVAAEAIVARLAAARPSPYTYRVAIAQDDDVNAFAAPGGYVVVYTGLLKRTKRSEELAGVLAHELQHVQRRHTTKALLRQASMQLMISALTGDMGQIAQAVSAAGVLGTLGYQRADEADADREGMRMVQAAHLDGQGMVDAFEMLRQVDDVKLPAFLSSHPDTGDRIAALKRVMAEAHGVPKPLKLDWHEAIGGCD
jgi:predicted Zn-dependent protease